MIDRRTFMGAAAGGLMVAPFATFAQLSTNVPRIGFLGSESESNQANRLEALQAGLRELGYIEGKTTAAHYPRNRGERFRRSSSQAR